MENSNPEQPGQKPDPEIRVNVENPPDENQAEEVKSQVSVNMKQIDPRDISNLTPAESQDRPKRTLSGTVVPPEPRISEIAGDKLESMTHKGRSQFDINSVREKVIRTPLESKFNERPISGMSRKSVVLNKLPKKTNIENKEIEWFAFENRVREIIRDILEPYAVRSIDLQESVQHLTENHDQFKRKQDEMEFVMHKRSHRNSGIDELNKKLFDIENERKVREAKNMQAIEGIKVQLESTQDRMTQIEELSLTFKKQANDIKHEINGFFDQLTGFQEKFSREQLKYKEEMNRNFLTLRNQYLKTEELSKVNKNYINNHFDELKRHDMVVQSYQKNFAEIYKKIQQMDKLKIDTSDFNDELIKIKKDVNHVRFLNEDVFQSVQLIDNYIEDFIPVKIERQLKEFYSKMNQAINQISPVYRYKQIFKKEKPGDIATFDQDSPKEVEPIPEGAEETKDGSKKQENTPYSSLGPKSMIEKYKKLTTDLEGQKEELNLMEEREIERIENLLKEEEEFELDADRVVDYLINLIAYLNDEEEQEGKPGQISRKKDISVKNLLKKRFQRAGFTKEAMNYKENRYGGQRSYSNSSKPTKPTNQTLKSTEDSKNDDYHQSMNRGHSIGDTSSVGLKKNSKSVGLKQDRINKEAQKSQFHDKSEFNHRKLKIEDLEEDTAEMIFKALDDVKEIKEAIVIEKSMIEETLKELKGDFGKEKEVLNAKFESKKGFIQKYVENIQKDLEEELIRRNREKANFNLKLKNLEEKVAHLKNNFNNQDDISEILGETVNLLVQTAMINHSMELQDEIDREKLALMGYKEEKASQKTILSKPNEKKVTNTNPYVTIDQQCLTCSGQSSVVMKAFKIACLAYKPSPVTFPQNEGPTYSRIDLINLKGRMLNRLEEIPITKSMRQEGANLTSERKQIFNMYLKENDLRNSQRDLALNSLFNTRQPKITIRSEAMSGSEAAYPGSPRDMGHKLSMKYEAEDFFKKNMTMLSDKTLALSRNPFNERGVKKLKKGEGLRSQFGSQTMSLPQIKSAREIDPDSINP